MITLYGPALAPYTEKVRRALLYKRLPFAFHEPESPEDYKRWNPKSGMLPAIEVDGQLIEDSTDILYALDDRYPDPPLLSSDPTIATRQRQLEDWADESFLWHFMKYRRMNEEGPPLPTAGSGRSRRSPPRVTRCAGWARGCGPEVPGSGPSRDSCASSPVASTTW